MSNSTLLSDPSYFFLLCRRGDFFLCVGAVLFQDTCARLSIGERLRNYVAWKHFHAHIHLMLTQSTDDTNYLPFKYVRFTYTGTQLLNHVEHVR